MRRIAWLVAPLALLMFGPLGCATLDNVRWELAQVEHSKEAYERYIANNPQSAHLSQARKLAETAAYEEACEKDSVEAYHLFLHYYSQSRYVKSVCSRIKACLRREADRGAATDSRKAWQPVVLIERSEK